MTVGALLVVAVVAGTAAVLLRSYVPLGALRRRPSVVAWAALLVVGEAVVAVGAVALSSAVLPLPWSPDVRVALAGSAVSKLFTDRCTVAPLYGLVYGRIAEAIAAHVGRTVCWLEQMGVDPRHLHAALLAVVDASLPLPAAVRAGRRRRLHRALSCSADAAECTAALVRLACEWRLTRTLDGVATTGSGCGSVQSV